MAQPQSLSPHPALQAIDLAAERGERTLFKDISFTLNPGEILHVCGRNGAGKTTLLRILCGLTRPVTGAVHWYGTDIADADSEFGSDLSYLAHHNGIKDELTGIENVLFANRLGGRHIKPIHAQAMLERIGIGLYADLPVKFLSQGQKRRVALSRLLLQRRPLWILDEPYTALDTQVIDVVLEAMHQHLDKGGMIVLTTHQEIEAGVPVTRLQLGQPLC